MKLHPSADALHLQNPCLKKQPMLLAVVQIALIGIWAAALWGTDAYYSVYVFCAAAGIACVLQNLRCPGRSFEWKESFLLLLFSLWFASTTLFANYRLFIVKPALIRYVSAALAMLGGTIAAYQVMWFAARKIPLRMKQNRKYAPAKVYLWSFLLLETVYLVYLLGAAYPGYFTPDVFSSLQQIIDGVYVNDNPFWYAMSIKLISGIGRLLFGTMNGSMAFYVFCQGLFMAAVFSYVLVTLYQIGVPGWIVAAVGAVYGLLPYNMAYSVTMLKDIPFSISSLLFVVSLYRIIRNVGEKTTLNYVFFGIGAFIFCLMRTNGFASFLVTMLVVLLLLRKSTKRVLVILVVVILVLTWILTNPVLDHLNVGATDFVEGLAVPFQQIARVITMGYELEPQEYELLDRVFYVDMIPEVFMHGCVDPIKRAAFREDGRIHLTENWKEYVELWFQMAKKYPGEYVKAWIELTKGYWNGGYKYPIYFTGGENQAIGIVRPESLPLQGMFRNYFTFVESLIVSQPLYSIGLHAWILFGCLVLNIQKKRTELVLAIPGIIILVGLWLGTPVYTEFRYAYPMILSIPLVLCTTLYHKDQN